ncbi:GDSL-type esterase/lipase family protein [Sphingobacterium olei]|nr:GDSL-type esterase/lipase family protein [Sphingobacterium olei]
MKYLIGVALWFSILGVSAQSLVAIDSNYVFSGYMERLGQYRQMPVLPRAIVFLGNSLTDAGKWNDIIPGQPVLNRGISGDISYGVFARLDEVVRHQPKKVFLMIGINDLKRGVPTENIVQNYIRIVRIIQQESPKTIIYLNSILPVNPSKLIESFKAVKNSDIEILNDGLKSIAQNQKSIHFVDLHQIFADDNGDLKADVTPDGIHLEVFAYVELVNYLKKVKAL